MAFFGRRKPGFAKETELTEQELTDKINDANNHTFREEQTPNTEKRDWRAIASAVIGLKQDESQQAPAQEAVSPEEAAMSRAELVAAAADEGTRMDLFEYLDSLPDVEDPFPPMQTEDPAQEQEEEELSEAQLLADFIRERSRAALLTSLTYLTQEVPTIEALLPAMEADPACATIKKIQGKKDVYYYDQDVMTDNYAMIAALIEDKDMPRTIAEMVRWNGKTYPSPTPVAYFTRHPYSLTEPQVKVALEAMRRDPAYSDIQSFVSEIGTDFLYSEQVMTLRYAKSLADRAEDDNG